VRGILIFAANKNLMKKNNQQTLGDAIQEYLKAFRLEGKLAETKAISSWEKLMGPLISRHTRNIYIRDKKCYITLDSSVLREELSYAKDKIKQMLNKEAGQPIIDEIIIF
jgi:predicted nucleic acid-binding Zn ribbon protein